MTRWQPGQRDMFADRIPRTYRVHDRHTNRWYLARMSRDGHITGPLVPTTPPPPLTGRLNASPVAGFVVFGSFVAVLLGLAALIGGASRNSALSRVVADRIRRAAIARRTTCAGGVAAR